MNDFSSIEKLVEFGMELNIAQQMVASMNQTMHNMKVPGSMESPDKNWYIAIDGRPSGPYTEREVSSMLLDKKITIESLMWCNGMSAWRRAGDIPEILRLLTLLPPAL